MDFIKAILDQRPTRPVEADLEVDSNQTFGRKLVLGFRLMPFVVLLLQNEFRRITTAFELSFAMASVFSVCLSRFKDKLGFTRLYRVERIGSDETTNQLVDGPLFLG